MLLLKSGESRTIGNSWKASFRRWPWWAVGVAAILPFRQSRAFAPHPFRQTTPAVPTPTVLFPHQFNGGYDAAMAVKWTPMQAAEFVIWHIGDTKDAGKQLMPLIQHWSGSDVGEFLTRLYLGEKNEEEFKLSFESRNVRNPQWKGLKDEPGRKALMELLSVSLPDQVLEPAEIARFADAFLLKEHTWPALSGEDSSEETSSAGTKAPTLEKDSFASLGYTTEIAKLFGELRRERFGTLTADDVLEMVLLPEKNVKESAFLQMHDFFWHIGIQMTPSEKIDIVQGMAQGGWGPANIAKFVSHIQEISEDERPKALKQEIKSKHKPPSFNPFPPKRNADQQEATTCEISNSGEDDEVFNDATQSASGPFYLGATHEYFSTSNSAAPAQTNGHKQADSVRT